jgi:hypothetical protein
MMDWRNSMKYQRVYKMLKAHGHSPAAAVRIINDAKRHDTYAIQWIRAVRRSRSKA